MKKGRRPDLNPIENMWHDLKIIVHLHSSYYFRKAGENLHEAMGENAQIQMWRAHRDIFRT